MQFIDQKREFRAALFERVGLYDQPPRDCVWSKSKVVCWG